MHDLKHFEEAFKPRFIALVSSLKARYPEIEVDVEAELEKYRQYAELLLPYVVDTVDYVHKSLDSSKRLMIEGANATMLDIDFGTYPYVTSSNPSIGGCITGLGIPPTKIGDIIGIVKAYTTRVGEGPFPTELFDEVGSHLCSVGREFGTTTGRQRRCGWLDIPQLQFSMRINGFTKLALTKLDILSKLKEIKLARTYKLDGKVLTSYPSSLIDLSKVEIEWEVLEGWEEDISKCRKLEDLPLNAQKYVKRIETLLKVPIKYIGVGPERNDIIIL